MKKYIYDESNGLWYEWQGDYYIPCLSLPEEEEQPIGLWGQRHLRYIREYRKALYNSLQLSGKLNSYLVDIDQHAEAMFSRLVEQMIQQQGVTVQLKASDQIAWGQQDDQHSDIGNRDCKHRNHICINSIYPRGGYFSSTWVLRWLQNTNHFPLLAVHKMWVA